MQNGPENVAHNIGQDRTSATRGRYRAELAAASPGFSTCGSIKRVFRTPDSVRLRGLVSAALANKTIASNAVSATTVSFFIRPSVVRDGLRVRQIEPEACEPDHMAGTTFARR
jgi:hypothetical protein